MEIGFTLAREHLTAPRSPDHARSLSQEEHNDHR